MIPWDTFKTPQDAYEWAKALEISGKVRGAPIKDLDGWWFVWIGGEFGSVDMYPVRR